MKFRFHEGPNPTSFPRCTVRSSLRFVVAMVSLFVFRPFRWATSYPFLPWPTWTALWGLRIGFVAIPYYGWQWAVASGQIGDDNWSFPAARSETASVIRYILLVFAFSVAFAATTLVRWVVLINPSVRLTDAHRVDEVVVLLRGYHDLLARIWGQLWVRVLFKTLFLLPEWDVREKIRKLGQLANDLAAWFATHPTETFGTFNQSKHIKEIMDQLTGELGAAMIIRLMWLWWIPFFLLSVSVFTGVPAIPFIEGVEWGLPGIFNTNLGAKY